MLLLLLRAICGLVMMALAVSGHGRLRDPPSRSSMWRAPDNFKTPKNYNDNSLSCGGVGYQYSKAVGGRCGVCGDKWGVDNPENEAGGTYAKGIIARTYRRGQSVRVRVEITAHHRGYFEFRLCPNNDFTRRVTHECLDRYVLPLTGSSGTRFDISHGTSGNYEVDVQLPSDVTCTQCVLQWKYHTGNSWGTNPDGRGCVGCGDQEEFYGCADVAIVDGGDGSGTATPPTTTTTATTAKTVPQSPTTTTSATPQSPTTTTSATPQWTTTTTTTTTAQTPTRAPGGSGVEKVCSAVGEYARVPGMHAWCERSCAAGFCPATHCRCAAAHCGRYVATGALQGDGVMDDFCTARCLLGRCPRYLCRCVAPAATRCTAVKRYAAVDGFDAYCQYTCGRGHCPDTHCACT